MRPKQQPEIHHHTALDVLTLMREAMAVEATRLKGTPEYRQQRYDWAVRVRKFVDIEESTLEPGAYGTIIELFEEPGVRRRRRQVVRRQEGDDEDDGFHPETEAQDSEWALRQIIGWFPGVLRTHTFAKTTPPPPSLEQFMRFAVAATNDSRGAARVEVSAVCRHAKISLEEGWAALAVLVEEDLAEVTETEHFSPKVALIQQRLARERPAVTNETHIYQGTNVAAMGPNASASRTTFQITSGGPAIAQVGGDELGGELVQLINALATRDQLACGAAAEALAAQKTGNEGGMLAALRKIPAGLITQVGGPLLLEFLKLHLPR